MSKQVELVLPNNFEADDHYYPRVINSQIHSMVSFFINLDPERLIDRYIHLHPNVSKETLRDLLFTQPEYFLWGGSDLFSVTTRTGTRKIVVIETNSCPSGQKSMPSLSDQEDMGGYKMLLEKTFLPALKKRKKREGALAVIYDKNYMESSGYAAALATLADENVYLTPLYDDRKNPTRFTDGVLEINYNNKWIPIRAAFRYVTQKPWNRIPVYTKTMIFNPIIVCLAGGRNKLLGAKAYDLLNAELESEGLEIYMPETVSDIDKTEIPLWIERFGGRAVVKNPYSNAGQGVYTITNQNELDSFMDLEHVYDQFIVQSLIGNSEWSSKTMKGELYHIGTVPNKKKHIYAADLRMMIGYTDSGFKPIAIYGRRAGKPLTATLESGVESWPMLGTNLSIKKGENIWDSDTSRLILMDRKDFNTLGIGVDDIINGFIQTVLSVTAIDRMAKRLISSKGTLKKKLFSSLNADQALMEEIKLING